MGVNISYNEYKTKRYSVCMYEHSGRCMAIGPSAARQHGSHVGWEGLLPADRGSCPPEDANTEESEASCSLGMCMYCRKAALCQQPRAWIVESSTPARAAEVAAPIRKLWPAYWCCGRPAMLRMLRISDTNWLFIKALFSESTKNGPGLSPRKVIKLRIAATGQRLDLV